jgi:folate-binding protein YgfZ
MTNDIGLLTPQQPLLYTAMLTPQGRFYGDFFLHAGPKADDLYLDVAKDFEEHLLKRLRLYKLRAVVEISNALTACFVVTQHGLPEVLEGLYLDPRSPDLGYRGLVFDSLPEDSQENPASYTKLCLKNGIPRYGIELIPEKTIPLEGNMEEMNALSFTKGCYVGQELTARTKHQGLVRKKLFPVQVEGNLTQRQWAEGIVIEDAGQKVGELLSAEQGLGIAKLRLEFLQEPGSNVWSGLLKDAKTECCKIRY